MPSLCSCIMQTQHDGPRQMRTSTASTLWQSPTWRRTSRNTNLLSLGSTRTITMVSRWSQCWMSSTQERCASLMYTHRYVYVRVIGAMFHFRREAVKFVVFGGQCTCIILCTITIYVNISLSLATFVLVKVYAIFNTGLNFHQWEQMTKLAKLFSWQKFLHVQYYMHPC